MTSLELRGWARAVLPGLFTLTIACGGGASGDHMALVGVTVLDGLGNPPVADRVVVLRGGRIVEIAAADGFELPRGARRIDLSRRYLMPGLVDAHAHVSTLAPAGSGPAGSGSEEVAPEESEQVLRTLLGFGITTVGVPSAPGGARARLRGRVAAGEVLGPRIVAAEEAREGPRAGFAAFAATVDEVSGAADRSSLRNLLTWLEEVDLDGPEIGARVAEIAASGVAVAPTLIATHAKFFGDDPRHLENPELHLAPAASLSAWQRSSFVDDWTPQDFARARAAWPQVLALLRKLHEGGVALAAGSDFPNPWVIPGVSLHQELRMLHDAGIPPLQVLAIATSGGAAALGLGDEVGSVEAGKAADLIVLANDPSANLMSTRAISHVFLGGRFYDPAALLSD